MNTRHLLTSCWLTLCASLSGTGAPPTTVTGTQGHSVSLPFGRPVSSDDEVYWIRVSPRNMIVKYLNGNISYFSNEQYKNRITYHPGNAGLEIHNLRREDSGDYEVICTAASSGNEYKTTVRLEVYEPVSGANITVQNITGTCNLTLTCSVTSGNPSRFSWKREVTGDNSSHHIWKDGKTMQVDCTAEMEDVVYRCEARNSISEDTAQVRLGDVCNLDTCPPKTTAALDSVMLMTVLSAVGTLLIFVVTVILTVTRRRRPEGREVTSGTEDQAETGIIYTNLQRMQKNRSVWQPPKGNDRFVGPEVVCRLTPLTARQ
ncbi:CD48 antigen-like isoform X2 [Mobula birostris]|uniref:CD48 antigen-like isoform X2 n=1 Tax=Mobula birostris TaxID=1983395 RepID=UPI003B27DFAC